MTVVLAVSACQPARDECERLIELSAYDKALAACTDSFARKQSVQPLIYGIRSAGELGDFKSIDELLTSAGDRPQFADAAYEAAWYAQSHNELQRTQRYADQSEALYRQAADQAGVASSLLAKNYVAWARSDWPSALRFAKQATVAARAADSRTLEAHALLSTFNVYQQTGAILLAADSLSQMEKLLDDDGSDLRYSAKLSRGLIEAEQENYGLAVDQFEQAIALSDDVVRKERVRALYLNAAMANIELGRIEKAGPHLQKVRENLESDGSSQYALLFFEGRSQLAKGEYFQALQKFSSALDRPDIDLIWRWQTNYYAGLAERRRGSRQKAIDYFIAATESLSSLRENLPLENLRAHLFTRRRAPYEALFLEYVSQGATHDALSVIELANSRTVTDALMTSIQKHASIESMDWPSDSVSMLGQLATRTSLTPQVPETANTVLIHFVAEGALWVAVVHQTKVEFLQSLPSGKLDQLLADYKENPSSERILKLLGRALIPPSFREFIGERLTIVPDRQTAVVALPSVLLDDEYLISRYELSLIPNLAYLNGAESNSDSAGSLVFGDPLSDLPAARQEANTVAQTMGIQPLLGESAKATALLAQKRYSVLHFSTHSGLDGSGPWIQFSDQRASGLYLAEKGIAADLVFLASCASGAPFDQDVWGSLGGSFMTGGSSNVVVSLWSIDDQATSQLVSDFYVGLRRGQSASQALANTQRIAIADSMPVVEWAPLMLLGNM